MNLLFEENSLFHTTETDSFPRVKKFSLEVNGISVPVRIFFENTYTERASIVKSGVIIRISRYATAEEKRRQIQTFLSWAKNKIIQRPEILHYLPQRRYMDGEVLKIGKYIFNIRLTYNKQRKSFARIVQNHILLSLASGLTPEAEQNTASYLVCKCLSRFFLPIVTERLHQLNDRFFKKQIGAVKLKYNTSNWGSCSARGNINISLRLMFAPDDVIDYVLIHELAHLVHHDHSKEFWRLVERIMPDYREKEKFLYENHFKFYL